MNASTPQVEPSREAPFGTLEYYQQELQSETSWRWLDAARNLADKAVANFERVLRQDYASTLGVSADDTEMDEAMIADVEAECAELHAKIVRDLQSERDSDVNRVRNTNGDYMSPVIALFKIATLGEQGTDRFLDISTLEGDLSFSSLAASTADGVYDKYSFDIDDPTDRELAIRAIISEQDETLFESQVRI